MNKIKLHRGHSPTLEDLDRVEEGVRAQKTHAQIAHELTKARTRVTNLARLLDLPLPVLTAVRSGRLAPKTAEALLSIKTEAEILAAYRHVTAHGLSAERTRAWIRERSAASQTSSADVTALERRMSEELCARVTITKSGSGHLIAIHATDLDCIDGIIERLGIQL